MRQSESYSEAPTRQADRPRGELAAGYSRENDLHAACAEAAAMVKAVLKAARIDSLLVFFDVDGADANSVRDEIRRQFMPKQFLAVRAAPLIAEGTVFSKGICVVAMAGVPGVSGSFGDGGNVRENTEKMLWRMAQEVQKPRKVYVGASSVVDTDISDHVKGLEVSVGKKAPMFNVFFDPSATDREVNIVCGELGFSRGAAGLSLLDNVHVSIKCAMGFHALGSSGLVAHAEDKHNVIASIGGKDAVEFYKRYFGERLLDDPVYAKRVFRRYPLGVRKNEFYYDIVKPHAIDGRRMLRCLQDVRAEDVRIMIPSRDGIITDLRSAALRTREKFGTDKVVLMLDTKERQRFFGTHYDRCVSAVQDVLGQTTVVGGVFYGIGFMYDSDDVALGHSVSEHACVLAALGA
jgi:hypothetical protein